MTKAGIATLNTVEIFCLAADKGSFTEAARVLGSTPSAVSKAVARLEGHLGVKLFQRSTRSIRLTDEGRSYHAACTQALTQIGQAEARLRRDPSAPMGTLRVSLPLSYGIKRIIPRLPRYLDAYPGRVKLVVSLNNSVADFVNDNVDLSVQLGHVADSRHIARPLHGSQFRVVASPAYLRDHGLPEHPDDLRRHHCIELLLPDTGRPLPWLFDEAGQPREPALSFRLSFDHPIAALMAAVNGAGLVRLLDFTVEAELEAGTLVEVLADFRTAGQSVSAIYPSGRHVPEKVRTFLDFLIEEGRAHRGLRPEGSRR